MPGESNTLTKVAKALKSENSYYKMQVEVTVNQHHFHVCSFLGIVHGLQPFFPTL